ADLDAEALAPFDALLRSSVPIFAEEPASHTQLEFVQRRGFDRLVSNAIIASPSGHPFWDFLLKLLRRCRMATNPLDATGPFVLTAAIDSSPLAERPRVFPAAVFSPFDKFDAPVPQSSEDVTILAHHHWMGSWYKAAPSPSAPSPRSNVRTASEDKFLRSIDNEALAASCDGNRNVLIAVPVLNAAETLDALFASILRLNYPCESISIAFLDGKSSDDSLAKLLDFKERHG